MKKLYLLFLLALAFVTSSIVAQNDDQDAEYLKLTKEYILHEDGSYDFHYRKELRLLTHFSFHRLFGETFIVYNPDYQQLKINEAYTVMADGKKVMTPENAFNEVLPGFARDIPSANHLREMVITHTGTEIGSVITLDYTIHTEKDYLPFFFGMEEIGENVPVSDMRIIIRVPSGFDLQYRMLNARTAPEITGADGQKSYTWNFGNVGPLPRSSSQDPERKANLLFTMAKDMTRAYFAFVDQPAFKSEPGPEISKRVESAVSGKNNDLDIILALQTIVIDEVKYADIPLAFTGYKVRTPVETWNSANGNALEKAVLLAEMLKLANINACPVASVPQGWYSKDFGNLAVIDGYMVQVNPKETGRIYLSVTQKQSQNLIYDVLDKTLIQLDGAIESMRTFQEKPVTNLLQMEGKIRLEDDKTISGELEIEMQGIANPFFRLRKDSSYVKTILTGDVAASQVEKTDLKQLSELKSKCSLSFKPSVIKQDFNGYLFFELPRYKTGFDSWNLNQFTGSGNAPVKLDHHLWENYKYKIELPGNYELFTPPADLEIKNSLGELKIQISQSGQTVSIVRSWEHSHDVVTTDNLEEFRQLIVAWENVNWRKIVFREKVAE